jgi:hypothetical protein
VFGLTKRERREREAREIHTWIFGQAIGIAGTIKPTDGKLYFDGTHTQMVIALEAACFFLHALSRFSSRARGEKLRETVLDPAVHQIATTFSEMLRKLSPKLDIPSLEQEVIDLFNTRDCEYGRASSLIGEKPQDRDSAVWLASLNVATAEHIPHEDIRVLNMATAFVDSLIAMELDRRVNCVEAYLTN